MKVVNIMSSNVLGGVEQVFLDYNEALNLKNHEVYAFYNKFGKIKIKLKTLKNVKYIPTLFIKPYFIKRFGLPPNSIYFDFTKAKYQCCKTLGKKANPIKKAKIGAKTFSLKVIVILGLSKPKKIKLINKRVTLIINEYINALFDTIKSK